MTSSGLGTRMARCGHQPAPASRRVPGDVHQRTGIRRTTRVPPPGRGPISHVAAAGARALVHDGSGRNGRRCDPPGVEVEPDAVVLDPQLQPLILDADVDERAWACAWRATLASASPSTRETTATVSGAQVGRSAADGQAHGEPAALEALDGRLHRGPQAAERHGAVQILQPRADDAMRRGDGVAQPGAAARATARRAPARRAARARAARARGPAPGRRGRRRRGSGARAPSRRAASAGAGARS